MCGCLVAVVLLIIPIAIWGPLGIIIDLLAIIAYRILWAIIKRIPIVWERILDAHRFNAMRIKLEYEQQAEMARQLKERSAEHHRKVG